MKRDYKIWAVILGIVIAGAGITTFTHSYVSGRSSNTAAYESAAPTEAAPREGLAPAGGRAAEGAADQAAEAAAEEIDSGIDSGAAAGQGAASVLEAAEAGTAELTASDGPPEALSEEGKADAEAEAESASAGIPEAAADEESDGPSLSEGSGYDKEAAVSKRAGTAGTSQAAALAERYPESAQSDAQTQGTASVMARSGAAAPEMADVSPGMEEGVTVTADYREKLAEYQERLAELDEQIERMRSSETDNTVHSVKSAAQTEQRIWERELDSVYTLLIGSLDEESGRALRAEQQKWIISRDQKAQEASKKNSGSSMESVEYIASIAASTRERVYALVEAYR